MSTQQTIAQTIADTLYKQRDALRAQWNNPEKTRTRHFVVDDLLPEEVCTSISAGFPTDYGECIYRRSIKERKKTLAQVYKAGDIIHDTIYAFQAGGVIETIEDITGLESLQPDPKLYAGGISMMGRGDFLNPHIDNSHNVNRSQYRRLNLLYYTTPGWSESDGGNLELWDDRVTEPVTIVSRHNRLVVMETTRYSWHSVSPVRSDRVRQCVSNYYFSDHSPEAEDYFHVTSFMGRPEQPVRRLVGRIDNAARNVYVKMTGHARGKIQQNDRYQDGDGDN